MTSSTTVPVSSQLNAPAAASGERFDLHRRVLVISFHYLPGSFSRNHAMFPRGQSCSQTYRLRLSE